MSSAQLAKFLSGSLSGLHVSTYREGNQLIEILLRGDSHYCTPEVLRFCRAVGFSSYTDEKSTSRATTMPTMPPWFW